MIGVFIQVVAVAGVLTDLWLMCCAVFGIPTAIMGDGFQGMVEEQKAKEAAQSDPEEKQENIEPIAQDSSTWIHLWQFLHAKTPAGEVSCITLLSHDT